jgi:hypothetical protein
MAGTFLYANSSLISREQLMTLSPPPATTTWRPIAHYDLIDAIDRQLRVRDVTIRTERFAVQRDGARLFGVLDLALAETDETCAALGIRNSTDKTVALDLAVGTRVFVCDNLAFSGDLIALHRKHTAKFDLNADISRAVDRYQTHLAVFSRQLQDLRERALDEAEAKVLVFEAFAQEILPLRLFPVVRAHYFGNRSQKTAWGLHNVFTSAVKQLAPAPAFAATVRLGKFFGLTSKN